MGFPQHASLANTPSANSACGLVHPPLAPTTINVSATQTLYRKGLLVIVDMVIKSHEALFYSRDYKRCSSKGAAILKRIMISK